MKAWLGFLAALLMLAPQAAASASYEVEGTLAWSVQARVAVTTPFGPASAEANVNPGVATPVAVRIVIFDDGSYLWRANLEPTGRLFLECGDGAGRAVVDVLSVPPQRPLESCSLSVADGVATVQAVLAEGPAEAKVRLFANGAFPLA